MQGPFFAASGHFRALNVLEGSGKGRGLPLPDIRISDLLVMYSVGLLGDCGHMEFFLLH